MIRDDWEEEVESELLVNVRRILVVLDRIRDEIEPPPVARELRIWRLALGDALAQYEMMMQERSD